MVLVSPGMQLGRPSVTSSRYLGFGSVKNQIKKGIFVACIGGGAWRSASRRRLRSRRPGGRAGTPLSASSATEHTSGTVTAIDKSTRIVTVKTDAGDKRSFEVANDVKAFES